MGLTRLSRLRGKHKTQSQNPGDISKTRKVNLPHRSPRPLGRSTLPAVTQVPTCTSKMAHRPTLCCHPCASCPPPLGHSGPHLPAHWRPPQQAAHCSQQAPRALGLEKAGAQSTSTAAVLLDHSPARSGGKALLSWSNQRPAQAGVAQDSRCPVMDGNGFTGGQSCYSSQRPAGQMPTREAATGGHASRCPFSQSSGRLSALT